VGGTAGVASVEVDGAVLVVFTFVRTAGLNVHLWGNKTSMEHNALSAGNLSTFHGIFKMQTSLSTDILYGCPSPEFTNTVTVCSLTTV
jgi:hypothetical protein